MKTKMRKIIALSVGIGLLLCPCILSAQKQRVVQKQISSPTAAVFSGKAAVSTHPVPKLGTAPRLSTSARVARAKAMTGANVRVVSNVYTFTLSPAKASNGNRGYLSFLGPSMVIGRHDAPLAMLNTGQTIELLLNVPSNAGKVLEVDLNVRSAGRSTITVSGMGSRQTFSLTNTAQRLTLLTLLPVSNDRAYWTITGTGDSWYFTGADISTIK